MNKFIIFTDLDGTLLDHEDYSFTQATQMLFFIKKKEIPLIFNTSKTKLESEAIAKKIGINFPFIVENGAAIYFPKKSGYYIKQFGVSHKRIKSFIDTVKDRFGILSFYDMSIDEIIKYTKLTYSEAIMAKSREYSEVFTIKDEDGLDELRYLANKSGFKIIKGGRFYHCVFKEQDKAKALLYMINFYQKKYNQKLTSIALGDSDNDIDMLKTADIAIVIPNKDQTIIKNIKNASIAPYKGSKGWNESLKRILLNGYEK